MADHGTKALDVALLGFTQGDSDGHYATSLANALIETDAVAGVSVLLPDGCSGIDSLSSAVGVRTFPFPSGAAGAMKTGFDPLFCRRVAGLVNACDPDVLHLLQEIRASVPLAAYLHRKYPTVLTVHEPKAQMPTLLRSLFLNPLQDVNTKVLIRSADSIVVHGEDSRDKLIDRGVRYDRIDKIAHGDFSSLFTPYADEDVSTDDREVLFFGEISPRKGLEYLTEGWRTVVSRRPTAKLTIAGSGDVSGFVGEDDRERNVTVINRHVPADEATELFQRAAFVVMPYRVGSQSGIPSIAGAFETPVVATDVGNFSEQIQHGHTGLIVPPRDPEALAKAMLKLLEDDRLRADLGATASRIHPNWFSWETIAAGHVRVYRETVDGGRGRR